MRHLVSRLRTLRDDREAPALQVHQYERAVQKGHRGKVPTAIDLAVPGALRVHRTFENDSAAQSAIAAELQHALEAGNNSAVFEPESNSELAIPNGR